MHVANDITELVGKTPLVRLSQISPRGGGIVLAKLEFFNPTGSVKDRIAVAMLDAAESAGLAEPGVTTIVEATNGKAGVALAMVCAAREYRCVLVAPDSISQELRRLFAAYGAEVVLTAGEEAMAGARKKADDIASGGGEFFSPQAFDNPVNPRIHYLTTGEEIWRDSDGHVSVLVGGVGTGGTLCGTAARLKEYNENIMVVAVEPKGSAVLSGGTAGPHRLLGIGEGIVPGNFDAEVVDEVFTVSDEDAEETVRALAMREGLLVGLSSGAAVYAAREVASRPEHHESTVVVIVAARGDLDHEVVAPL
jgi:cysteine synthase